MTSLLGLLIVLILSLHQDVNQATSTRITSSYYEYTAQPSSIITRKEGGTIDENYGIGIASCGDTLFIGSYTDKYHYIQTGAVYIYTLSSSQKWLLDSKIHPSYVSSDIYYGWSISCQSNSTVYVGAYGDNSLGIDKAGAVYSYEYIISGIDELSGQIIASWKQTGIFYSKYPQEYEYFGWAIEVNGNFLVVSAIGNSELHAECGVVYIFKYSSIVVSSQSKSKVMNSMNDGGEGDLDGDNSNNDDGGDDKGYFEGGTFSAPDGWELDGIISPVDPYPYMNFGWSLGMYDGVVVVSAPWMYERRGVVYLYNRQITEQNAYDDLYYADVGDFTYDLFGTVYSATLINDMDLFELDTKSFFGYSVDIDGDLIVVGHYLGHSYVSSEGNGEDDTSVARTGGAYVFRFDVSDSTVRLVADLRALVEHLLGELSFFGYHVSIEDGTIVVGAPGDGHSNNNSSVFVFAASDSNRNGWYLKQHWYGKDYTPSSPYQPSDQLEASRFGIATSISNGGHHVFASDSHGMSKDYIQTGCVFSWFGTMYYQQSYENTKFFDHHSISLWLFSLLVAVFASVYVYTTIKQKQRLTERSDLDRIFDESNSKMSMSTCSDDDQESVAFPMRVLHKIADFIRQRGSSEGMQMMRLPTDSSHHGERPSGEVGRHGNIDARKLIATAQAVADDDNHPNHEEVEELIRSYKREWISSERFQQEFQRLVF